MATTRAPLLLILAFALALPLQVPIRAASFNESCRAGDPPCTALLAYRSSSAELSLAKISALFSVAPPLLLAANAFAPSSDLQSPLAEGETIRIPVACSCANSQRGGGRAIVYTVVSGDSLDAIARSKYGGLVTYQEIAAANGIPDPTKILPDQRFVIPYPCSCLANSFAGRDAVYMSYVVQEGESALGFSVRYNLSQTQLLDLNPSANLSEAGAVIRLPVPACSAQFARSAIDSNLTVVEGAYGTTAGGCVQCSCSGAGLHCARSPVAPRSCSLRCPNTSLEIGNFSTRANSSGGCSVQSCLYDGYSGSRISTRLETSTTNESCGAVESPPSFAYAPEGEGIPEALGPASSIPGSPNSPGSTPGSIAPPPQSRSTQISASFAVAFALSIVAMV